MGFIKCEETKSALAFVQDRKFALVFFQGSIILFFLNKIMGFIKCEEIKSIVAFLRDRKRTRVFSGVYNFI